MKYVLDANVGLKTVLVEVDTPKPLALLDEYKRKIHHLIAPDTYLVECGHALTRAERKKLIKPPEGFQKLIQLATTRPELFLHLSLMGRAFEISTSMLHGLYDCLYLALAEQEGCQVVSADVAFAKKFHSEVITLDSL